MIIAIAPLPSKDGTVTGTLLLSRKLIIDIHERAGVYNFELHTPSGQYVVDGRLARD